MENRSKIGKRLWIVIALLALFIPAAVFAQEKDVTLAGLSDTIQVLTADFNVFARELVRTNDRIDALENQVIAFAEAQYYEDGESGGNRACIVAAKEYGHLNSVNQLRAETINGFSEKYGQSIPAVGLFDVRAYPKHNAMTMKYKPYDQDLYILSVIERWQGCVFIGFEFEERRPNE